MYFHVLSNKHMRQRRMDDDVDDDVDDDDDGYPINDDNLLP